MEFKQIKGPITCTFKTQCCYILLMFLLRTLKKKSSSLTSSLFFSCIGEQCRVATIDTTRSNGPRVVQGLGCASRLSSYTIRQRHVYFPETRHMSCALFLSPLRKKTLPQHIQEIAARIVLIVSSFTTILCESDSIHIELGKGNTTRLFRAAFVQYVHRTSHHCERRICKATLFDHLPKHP